MIDKNFQNLIETDEAIIDIEGSNILLYVVDGVFIVLFILLFLTIILSSTGKEFIGNGLFYGTASLIMLIFLLVSFSLIFSHISRSLMLTDKRVISLEIGLPFSHTTKYLSLSDLTLIEGETKGILNTLFSSGTIKLTGHENSIIFKHAKSANNFIQKINHVKTAKKDLLDAPTSI